MKCPECGGEVIRLEYKVLKDVQVQDDYYVEQIDATCELVNVICAVCDYEYSKDEVNEMGIDLIDEIAPEYIMY